jgi:chemotaxis protein methyltransferase CheR
MAGPIRPAAAPVRATRPPLAGAARAEAADGIPISPEAFRAISERVRALTGIVLKDHKRQMVYTRLARRLRALGMADFESYLDHLDTPAGAGEVGELINAITTNLTAFFRETHHFEHLAAEIVRPRMQAGAGRLRIWSAGCSTGEEPYSIQMTLQGEGALARSWDYRLLATDLDSAVLAQAEAGRYPAERLQGIAPARLAQAAERQADGSFVMKRELRAAITFRRLNLLEPFPVRGPFDAIFCRNVLIYFDAETKADIVNRLADLLAPHGALYLGHSESLLGEHAKLVSSGRTTYRKRK